MVEGSVFALRISQQVIITTLINFGMLMSPWDVIVTLASEDLIARKHVVR